MIQTWTTKDNSLVKEFEFPDFQSTIDFVNQVANLANQANHHPDLFIYSYRKLRITLTTHSANKITNQDYSLAQQIDALLKP